MSQLLYKPDGKQCGRVQGQVKQWWGPCWLLVYGAVSQGSCPSPSPRANLQSKWRLQQVTGVGGSRDASELWLSLCPLRQPETRQDKSTSTGDGDRWGGPHIWSWVLEDHIFAWTGLLSLSQPSFKLPSPHQMGNAQRQRPCLKPLTRPTKLHCPAL